MTHAREDLLSEACRLVEQADALAAKYGNGTRPAWVGEEIGMLTGRADHLKKQAETAEE